MWHCNKKCFLLIIIFTYRKYVVCVYYVCVLCVCVYVCAMNPTSVSICSTQIFILKYHFPLKESREMAISRFELGNV